MTDLGLALLPEGGNPDPQASQLEETLALLARHSGAMGEIVASLESMERMALVQEAGWVFAPVVRARALARAAAQALADLLAEPR